MLHWTPENPWKEFLTSQAVRFHRATASGGDPKGTQRGPEDFPSVTFKHPVGLPSPLILSQRHPRWGDSTIFATNCLRWKSNTFKKDRVQNNRDVTCPEGSGFTMSLDVSCVIQPGP